MGQYFLFICILNDTFIQFICNFCCEGGSKFLEMAYKNNKYMLRMEKLLSVDGLWHKQRVILAGEYAEKERNRDFNLFTMTQCKSPVTSQNINPITVSDEYYAKEDEFRYILNHDKGEYVDKQKCTKIHPLAILLEDGYNEGGEWKRQRISVQNYIPENFIEYIIDESEYI